MKSTSQLIDESKAQWNRIKTEMEGLNVQMALGKNEARDAFDREWKKFSQFLEEQSNRLRRQSSWAGHLLEELEQRTRALKEALKSLPDAAKKFATWRENTLRTVYELEFIIDELYPVLERDEQELLSSFRIAMEVYRTRLVSLSFEELSVMQSQAARVSDKADDVLIWRDRDSEVSQEKMRQFGKEIGTSFDHMKKAFTGLFK